LKESVRAGGWDIQLLSDMSDVAFISAQAKMQIPEQFEIPSV
jgi:hypothetical protein